MYILEQENTNKLSLAQNHELTANAPINSEVQEPPFRGLLHDIRMSFVQERVHTGCHIITSVKFIRNESFLSEFIGVFITERNTHSGRPFLPVQCKRGTALIFV